MFRTTTAAVALLATIAAPGMAQAQFRPGPPPGGEYHRDHHRIDGGSLVLGAIAAGGLIALLSAASKNKQAPPPPPPPSSEEDQAANACADAVEAHLWEEDHREARVQNIASVSPREQGGWSVRGNLRVADNSPDGYHMRFSCTVKRGQVRALTIGI